MNADSVQYIMFLIFFGAAVVATLAMMARQAMLVSYIVLGIVLGPGALGWVGNAHLIREFSDIGILFLLFLLGLNLPPHKLAGLVRETTIVTVVSAAVLAAINIASSLASRRRLRSPPESVAIGLRTWSTSKLKSFR